MHLNELSPDLGIVFVLYVKSSYLKDCIILPVYTNFTRMKTFIRTEKTERRINLHNTKYEKTLIFQPSPNCSFEKHESYVR